MNNVLIMAGGESSRMKKSAGNDTHKALATVFDIPLIELNLLYSYLYGFKKIWVSVSINEPELLNQVNALKSKYEKQFEISIQLIIEKQPLGSIGAVQLVECNDKPLLILFVDNLLALNLRAFIDSHILSGACMTVASHIEPFKMPFGELIVEGDTLIDYIEKPEYKILISSGTYIIGQEVQHIIRNDYANTRLDVYALTKNLIRSDFKIHSYLHDSVWMDINDHNTLLQAQNLRKWPLIDEIKTLRNKLMNN